MANKHEQKKWPIIYTVDYQLTVKSSALLHFYHHCLLFAHSHSTTQTTQTHNMLRHSLKKLHHLSIKARNLCLSVSVCVCVCVCVCLKYLCGSGSDWPVSFNMAAAWFNGVQLCICLDYNDTVNKLFHKCFTNSASIVHRGHRSHVHTRVNHCRAQAHNIP